MSRKILCYDLHDADRDDYQEVYDYIEEKLNGTRATESVFIFFSDLDNKSLRDTFVQKFGKGISVLVNDFPANAAWDNIENTSRWKNQ